MENIALLEQFKNDCCVIDLHEEYPGFVGEGHYGIVTKLSQQEISEKYRPIISEYMPFILLTLEEGEIIKDYWRNNRKHQRRKERTESIFGFDDETEIKHAEVRSNNDPIEEIIRNENRRNVNRALALLSQKQRTRVIKHFYDNKSLGEIAGEEGVNKNAIAKSVEQALKIMNKFFENGCTN